MPHTCSACPRRRVAAQVPGDGCRHTGTDAADCSSLLERPHKGETIDNAAAAHQALRLDRRTAAQCRAGLPGVAGCRFCGIQSDGSQSARLTLCTIKASGVMTACKDCFAGTDLDESAGAHMHPRSGSLVGRVLSQGMGGAALLQWCRGEVGGSTSSTFEKKRPMASDSGCAARVECAQRSSAGARRHRARPRPVKACMRASPPIAVLYTLAATPSTTMLPVCTTINRF